MTGTDERIGANLQNLRGDMSQSALAAAMRAKGWKWSQPTVVAIEKGERSIKLAEAEHLVEILELESIDELTTRPLESIWWARWATLGRSVERLEGAAAGYLNARAALAQATDHLERAGQAVPIELDEVEQAIRQSVSEVAHSAQPDHLAMSDPVDKWMTVLYESDYREYAESLRASVLRNSEDIRRSIAGGDNESGAP